MNTIDRHGCRRGPYEYVAPSVVFGLEPGLKSWFAKNPMIPLTDHHLRRLLCKWVAHYNEGRPHMSLGPGIPQAPASLPIPLHEHRHRISPHLRVVAGPVLGGLHHNYWLEKAA
jgi:hypothetical protein